MRARPARSAASGGAASPQATEQTLYELGVHQIELEMQNKELQRRQAELSAANKRYFDLYDLAPVGYFTLSEAGLILQTNLTASNMLGYARSALVKQAFSRFIFRDDMDSFYLMCRALLKSSQAQAAEMRMMKQDGTQFWAHVTTNISPGLDGTPQLRLVLSDISERKAHELEREHYRAALEEQVMRRTQQYLDLYDQAPCGYHTLSPDGVIVRANQTELALLGYAPQEYVNHRLEAFLTPASARLFNDSFRHLLEAGRSRDLELDFFCKDGAVRSFSIDSELVSGTPGETRLCHSTMVDISERKQNAQRLELALMGADLGLWDLKIASGELHLSARACAMLGYPEGGLGRHVSDLEKWLHPEDAPAQRAALQAIYAGDVPNYRQEYRLRHADGHWVWVRSLGRVVARDDHSNPLRAVGTLQDISQEKQLKQEGADLLQRIESLIHSIGKLPEASPGPVPASPATVLGAREQQVIQLIAAGCTSAEIGEHLGISTSTAATHRRNLMRKLDLHSSAELTRYAVTHKLVSS
jgi:PAS domain S-box-containing protein